MLDAEVQFKYDFSSKIVNVIKVEDCPLNADVDRDVLIFKDDLDIFRYLL